MARNDTARKHVAEKPNTKRERSVMQKPCPVCNTIFDTIYADKIYCTDTCQRRQKTRNRALRRKGILAEKSQLVQDDRFHATIANPTFEQLLSIFVDIQDGKITKPVLVIGFMPKDYMKPDAVDVTEQVNLDPNAPKQWLLTKHEESIFDMLK
jgi:hypothetical protein